MIYDFKTTETETSLRVDDTGDSPKFSRVKGSNTYFGYPFNYNGVMPACVIEAAKDLGLTLSEPYEAAVRNADRTGPLRPRAASLRRPS